jgi:hypothetical protein
VRLPGRPLLLLLLPTLLPVLVLARPRLPRRQTACSHRLPPHPVHTRVNRCRHSLLQQLLLRRRLPCWLHTLPHRLPLPSRAHRALQTQGGHLQQVVA